MGFFEWFRKRHEMPASSMPQGEMRETLTQEAVRSQVEAIKQVGAATELQTTITEALNRMATHTLKEIRRSNRNA